MSFNIDERKPAPPRRFTLSSYIPNSLGGIGRPISVGRPVVVDLVGWTVGLAGVPGVGRPA